MIARALASTDFSTIQIHLTINTTFKTPVFALLLLTAPLWCFSQDKKSFLDAALTQYSNKTIPDILGEEIKMALSFFPELKETSIDFILKEKINKVTMQAQPRIKTLFKKKSRRTYKIKISKHLNLGEKIKPIEDIPTDILVGWIAHELGHIMDYLDRSSFQMIGFGFRYLTSKSFVMNAERQADVYAINHGFADQIIKTKNYILNGEEDLSAKYRQRIDLYYISPEEVRIIEEKMESVL
ncbi:MAG: hypothetical protein WD555_06520 [Fulvivirga sp.]